MKTAFRYFLALLALGVALAPIYWLATISLKKEIDQFTFPPIWFQFAPTGEHYREAFLGRYFGRYFLNSVIVASGSTILALVIGVPAAYALARFRWRRNWDERISFWILSTRMLPPIVSALPLLLLLRQLGLLDSLVGLGIVYTAFNLPFVVWMMRGFFEEVPWELEEAALLDGDSRIGALVRIILPVVRPGLAATAVFSLIVAWNEFLFACCSRKRATGQRCPLASLRASHNTKSGGGR
jgi:multiple sugar transport system permease protein